MLRLCLILCFIVININTFVVYRYDKLQSQNNGWRVKESTLLWLAAVGGSVGALLAMYIFRHKTLHKKFYIGVPCILLLQIALFYAYFRLF